MCMIYLFNKQERKEVIYEGKFKNHIHMAYSWSYMYCFNICNYGKLRNKNVVIKRSQLPEPENGTYYIDDLIGSDVLVDGDKIGILTKIEQFGSADVYEVTLEQGTVNFPAIKDVFSYVDVKKGVINLKGYIFSRICVYN